MPFGNGCVTKLILQTCRYDNAGTSDVMDVEFCKSDRDCQTYSLGYSTLESDTRYTIVLPSDEYTNNAESASLTAAGDDGVCLSAQFTKGPEQSVPSVPIWLDSTCEVQEQICPCNTFSYNGFMDTCEGKMGQLTFSLSVNQEQFITTVPPNTRGLSVTLSSALDFDLKLYVGTRNSLSRCLAGFGCEHAEEQQSIFNYNGMVVIFSGDMRKAPVSESILIPYVTEYLTFQIKAYNTGDALVTFSWEAVEPCETLDLVCSTCGSYEECPPGTVPYCDGSPQVLCLSSTEASARTAGCDGYSPSEVCDQSLEINVPSCDPDVDV
eukprot:UN29320